jgi:hypothetical protein
VFRGPDRLRSPCSRPPRSAVRVFRVFRGPDDRPFRVFRVFRGPDDRPFRVFRVFRVFRGLCSASSAFSAAPDDRPFCVFRVFRGPDCLRSACSASSAACVPRFRGPDDRPFRVFRVFRGL